MLFSAVTLVSAQVFIGTEPTGNPVLLEVKSTSQGVLLPRIDIPNVASASPVVSPKEGLLVVNTHAGEEGLYFWNGNIWEKLETVESADKKLNGIGKKTVFIGTSVSPFSLTEKTNARVYFQNPAYIPAGEELDQDANGKLAYQIKESGIYEITASFASVSLDKGNKSSFALSIYNYKESNGALSCTTGNQESTFSSISAKAAYCGFLDKGAQIGLRLFYYTIVGDRLPPQVKVDISIKKIVK
jgi:hypothetical protein